MSIFILFFLLFVHAHCYSNDVVRHSSVKNKLKDLPSPKKPDYDQCKLLTNSERFDCFPQNGANQQVCEARGCCWVEAKRESNGSLGVPLDVPWCFYPPNYDTYQYVNVTETSTGLLAYLKRSYSTTYPDDVETIAISVKYETENRLHVKIYDPLNSRYETSYPEVPVVDKAAENRNYVFDYDTKTPGFKVLRKSDNTVIFDTNKFMAFTFANQFLQISSKLPSNYIYGLGEHVTSLLLNTQTWSRYTMWNHDIAPNPYVNLYGTHPFYISMENSSNSHGVFLLNSNGMDVLLQPLPAITFRTVGGVLDFYFFMGPTPADVIEQYTDLIGRPYMPPYWGLGFHLCRYGYLSLETTKKTMERNIAAGIPLDTQWNDLDYMNNSNGFTYDHQKFAGLPEFVNDLHSRGMHWIPLVDPGVSAAETPGTYPPFDDGVKMDIFVKNSTGDIFVGKVWNAHSTVWPDFTNPKTKDYWKQMLGNFHKEVAFDGAWIDMNEPSNFLSGSFDGCPKTDLDSPPYTPAVDGGALNSKTLCMSAKQHAGWHYDVHNLYGFTEAIVTSGVMAEIRSKRPMVISRSTFSGHGHHAGHWSGDVFSTWDGIKQSIPQLLNFNMFGVPLMGADICGFIGDTTEALCNRWQQLGAFYPFSRNHNNNNAREQDPAAMGDLVVSSTKKALAVRYALLPYLYTLFYKAHVYGDTVARPLFVEFYKDKETYGVDTEFLWGSGLLIVPVLQEGATSVKAYLPSGIWYDYYTKDSIKSSGQSQDISAPLDTIPLFVRGGSILPQQDAKQTTTESRKTKINLLVAPDANGEASGDLFWDDGDSLNTIEDKKYSLINFSLKDGTLSSKVANWAEEYPPHLGSLTVMGVPSSVSQVTVNSQSAKFKYDSDHKFLTIDSLDVSFEKSLVVSWK